MKWHAISLLLLWALIGRSQAAQIHGMVRDAENRSPLAEANVQIDNAVAGAVADKNGEFILPAPIGQVTVTVSFIGYKAETRTIVIAEDKIYHVDFMLAPQSIPAEEIVVSSLRYEQSLKNIATPMNIVRRERIDQLMPRDVAAVVEREAGLAVTRDGVWGSNVAIRGLSRNNIVMLVDGNRIDTANDLVAGLSMIDVNDIDRVEVIKGAASSLYGSGAVGGVVNVLTKDGWYQESLYLQTSMTGGYSSVNRSGMGSLQLNGGGRHWYAKVSANRRSAGDATTPIGVLPNSRYSDHNLSGRVGLKISDHHEFKVNLQQYRGRDIGIPGGNQLFSLTADVRYPRENRDLMSVEYIGKRFTSSMAKLSLKYFQQDILRDVENIPYTVKDVAGTPAKRMNVLSILPRATHKTDGMLLQSDWTLAGHYVIAGVDAWQKKLDSYRERYIRVDVLAPDGSTAKSVMQTVAERPLPISTYRSVGAYAQDELAFFEQRLRATIGGRIDKITVDNDAVLQPVFIIQDGVRSDTPAGQFTMWESQKENDWSWSGNVNLLYRLSDTVNITTAVARSFRSPYLEERYQYIDLGNLVKIGDPNLEPENGTCADIGVNVDHGHFYSSLHFFYNRIKNMVVETPAVYEGRNALKKENVGSAELYGADLQMEVPLGGHFSAYSVLSWVHAQDTFLNEPLPLTPPLNGRLGVEMSIDQLMRVEVAASMFADQRRTAPWEIETPGYVVFDILASSRIFSWGGLQTRLFFGVENVLDRAYRNHLSTNRGSIAIEPGRNFTLRVQMGM